MTEIKRTLPIPPGFRSAEAALFVAQMDDQSRRLTEHTRGLSADELEWQPAPGMNTIGMLLAHIAVVEVWWTMLGPLAIAAPDIPSILGIHEDADGMPLPEGAPPPADLRGEELAFFDDLLARARAHTKQVASKLADPDLDRVAQRKRPDGTLVSFDVRWVLYHMLEHQAGHYGQINMLRHHCRLARARA